MSPGDSLVVVGGVRRGWKELEPTNESLVGYGADGAGVKGKVTRNSPNVSY